MTDFLDRLRQIAERLQGIVNTLKAPAVKDPLDRLSKAAENTGEAWSGSWLGYHSRVYYNDLQPPPPGAHFSQEWGLIDSMTGTRGDWHEYRLDDVESAIHERAGNPDLSEARAQVNSARTEFKDDRDEILSILTTALMAREDPFLANLKAKAEGLKFLSARGFIEAMQPRGQFMSRDSVALGQGFTVPPHIAVQAEVFSLQQPAAACAELADVARKSASHLETRSNFARLATPQGTCVFIGHGRSLLWKELKDFIQDRLHLPWDEFNRVPIAGVTNIARLSQMLDNAAIAFLVLTPEDEQADGKLHARLNVVHEAGLFQGKLGFNRAIILVEEGCELFSNIDGLGQIRFPAGNIRAAFEEIRQVLEREALIESNAR
jgi:predicted nucleotide-binding protein